MKPIAEHDREESNNIPTNLSFGKSYNKDEVPETSRFGGQDEE